MKIVKTGKFSPKYYYIAMDTGAYYLMSNDQFRLTDGDRIAFRGKATGEIRSKPSIYWKTSLTEFKITVGAMALLTLLPLLQSISQYLVVALLSLLLHELGHVLVASRGTKFSLEIGVGLQYRILPILFVSNRYIYEQSRRHRLMYYSGGIIMNAFLAICAFLLSFASISSLNHDLTIFATRVNLIIALLNLYPLLFTDGFNLLREALEIYDLRRVALSSFFKPRKALAKGRVYLFYVLFLWSTFILFILRVAVLLKSGGSF